MFVPIAGLRTQVSVSLFFRGPVFFPFFLSTNGVVEGRTDGQELRDFTGDFSSSFSYWAFRSYYYVFSSLLWRLLRGVKKVLGIPIFPYDIWESFEVSAAFFH